MRRAPLLLLLASCVLAGPGARASSTPTGDATAVVGSATYHPIGAPSSAAVDVRPFRLDRDLVTNGDFLAFIESHPTWRRDRVARVFADEGYLSSWKSAGELGERHDARQPVVEVSWFAARAYCTARGMRLPTEAEWEIAAAASPTRADGAKDATWQAELDGIYSRPEPPALPLVGGAPNFWGVRDLHGVVWEWVLDFSSAAPVDCSRGAGGAVGAALDFPAFERAAMRSALRGDTTTPNLGFRCAADLPSKEAP